VYGVGVRVEQLSRGWRWSLYLDLVARCETVSLSNGQRSRYHCWLAAPVGIYDSPMLASPGSPGSATPEWIDGGIAPHHRTPSRACFHSDGLGASFLSAIRPIAEADVLPYGLPLHGVLGGAFGVGLGAFVVTGALSGRDGIVDLGIRSQRSPFRWA
jgi:hypothetical protein